jgi:hypothetical protein
MDWTGMTQNMYQVTVMKPPEISPLEIRRGGLADDIKIHLDAMGMTGGWEMHLHVVRCWNYS